MPRGGFGLPFEALPTAGAVEVGAQVFAHQRRSNPNVSVGRAQSIFRWIWRSAQCFSGFPDSARAQSEGGDVLGSPWVQGVPRAPLILFHNS